MAGRGSVCAIYGCNNYKLQKERKSFFRFPRQKELCTQWVILSKRPDLDDVLKNKGPEHLNKNYVVCSDHFQVKDFRNRNLLSQGLFKGSIPSQSLSKESSCQPTVKNNQLRIKQISQQTEDIEKPVTESTGRMTKVKEEFEEFDSLEHETVCTEVDHLGIMGSEVGCSEKDCKPSLDEEMLDSKLKSNKVDFENSLNRVDCEENDSKVEKLFIKQEGQLSPVESEMKDIVKEEPEDVDDLESLSSHCKMEHVDIKVEKSELSTVEDLLEKPEENEAELYKTGKGGSFKRKLDEQGERLIGQLHQNFSPVGPVCDSDGPYQVIENPANCSTAQAELYKTGGTRSFKRKLDEQGERPIGQLLQNFSPVGPVCGSDGSYQVIENPASCSTAQDTQEEVFDGLMDVLEVEPLLGETQMTSLPLPLLSKPVNVRKRSRTAFHELANNRVKFNDYRCQLLLEKHSKEMAILDANWEIAKLELQMKEQKAKIELQMKKEKAKIELEIKKLILNKELNK